MVTTFRIEPPNRLERAARASKPLPGELYRSRDMSQECWKERAVSSGAIRAVSVGLERHGFQQKWDFLASLTPTAVSRYWGPLNGPAGGTQTATSAVHLLMRCNTRPGALCEECMAGSRCVTLHRTTKTRNRSLLLAML